MTGIFAIFVRIDGACGAGDGGWALRSGRSGDTAPNPECGFGLCGAVERARRP